MVGIAVWVIPEEHVYRNEAILYGIRALLQAIHYGNRHHGYRQCHGGNGEGFTFDGYRGIIFVDIEPGRENCSDPW